VTFHCNSGRNCSSLASSAEGKPSTTSWNGYYSICQPSDSFC